MPITINQLLNRPLVRYLIVGGSVYVFEIAVIVIAQAQGASAVAAVTISYCLGTLLAFLFQKFVTFGDKRVHHRVVIPQLLATCALVAWNLAFTLLLTRLLDHILPTVVTRTIAIAVTTLWNFYLYRTRIFKSTDNPVY